MDSGKTTRRDLRPSTRRLIQLYSALLHNARLRGFIDGEIYAGRAKYACVPGLNCYSCPGAVGACPLGALQNALASAGHRAGWYVLGILLLFGVCLGRTVCGWLCPLGLIQELLHRIPTVKIRKSAVTRALSWLKYAVLAVFVIALPLWYGLRHDLPLPAFCKYICPAGTLEGAVALLAHPGNSALFGMLGALFTNKIVVMLLVGLACVFCYRSFCRFLCPLGAIYGLFNRFCLVGVRVDESRCTGCGACVAGCGMDVHHVGDRECIHCAGCVGACPEKAISLKAGSRTVKAPEKPGRRRLVWGAALAILCAALVWFNLPDPSAQTPAGSGVGMLPEDFAVECLDGTEFRLSEHRGEVVFINLWATWCAPCVEEMPGFVALSEAHGGDVAVLAVHSPLVTDDPAAFVSDRGWTIPVAVDREELVWGAVGGSSTLPQTVVLNRRGEVVYNRVGSVTPELLETLYREACG